MVARTDDTTINSPTYKEASTIWYNAKKLKKEGLMPTLVLRGTDEIAYIIMKNRKTKIFSSSKQTKNKLLF
jgi:hypothetical protein